MKRTISISILLLLITSATLFAEKRRNSLTVANLPAISREFLNKYFHNIDISYVEIDKDLFLVSGYEVILTDGTEINFTRKGEWIEVERNQEPVPPAIIPKEIIAYVKAYFPKMLVLAIEKESRKWEIKLNNGIELSFNRKGELIEVDAD
ncbi:PepSY-like domain-containing protein [Parabacteroides sp. OttesenSCG-928-G06]|nr:PepSY-like domain-containing protein [Parabacteroides sp. OttesenSCG-928-K15]MDL2281812.1 PepSY-like domain-containing protein [Parabacteroides sp. OttesenSCG-928-G06]